jgi:PKD repeat protein
MNDVNHCRFLLGTLALCLLASGAEAATRRVCASGCDYTNLQAAIDAAAPGDTILLRAGETYVGHYWLKRKTGTADITIRSDADASRLPAQGVRLVPSGRSGANTDLSALPRLIGRGSTYRTTPIFRAEASAHNYRLQFLNIDGAKQEGYEQLIEIGNNTTQTSASMAPHHIVLDRVYIHGHPNQGQKRCLALNSAYTDVVNSYIADCKSYGVDSQAIASFNAPGPLRIENNYIEGAAENIMFGGSDPRIPNLVPSDITIRRNHITKNLAWRNPILRTPGSPRAVASSASGTLASGTHYFKVEAVIYSASAWLNSLPSTEVSVTLTSNQKAATVSWAAVPGAGKYRVYHGRTAGGEGSYMETSGPSTTLTYTGSGQKSGKPHTKASFWNVKNLIELKNAQRVLIEGNVIEYAWKASQTGYAIVLTPRNQDETAPWSVVRDVTIRYNTVRHVNGGLNILGHDYSSTTGSGHATNFKIQHNLFADVGGQWGGGAFFLVMTEGPSNVTLDHNTIFQTSNLVVIDNGKSTGFVFTNNMAPHNTYGVIGSGVGMGTAALEGYFPDAVFRKNVLAGGKASLYPPDNFFPSVETFHAQFVNYAAGDYRLVSTSPYIGAGTDGLNLGADLTTLSRVQQSTGAPPPSGNTPPTAKAGGPYSGHTGSAITVDGRGSSDPGGTIASYRWTWGDGSAAGSGATASHTYTKAGTFTVTLTVTDNGGATGTATTTATVTSPTQPPPPTTAKDIVLTAANVSILRGDWQRVSSTGSPAGLALRSVEKGWWKTDSALANPKSYFEATFQPAANTPYRVWLRLKAPSKSDDSVWVQFTGSVDAQNKRLWRVGTTGALPVVLEECDGCGVSGWGWQDGAPWITTPSIVRFSSNAPQTIRVQTREDGVTIDEIVLSPSTFMTTAPGAPSNDGTILPGTTITLAPRTVVLRAADAVRAGTWTIESDSTAAGGQRVASADKGAAIVDPALASPGSYAQFSFAAVGNVKYRVWFRMAAAGNSKASDSVWVQYDDLVSGKYKIGGTSGIPIAREACSGCAISGWGWTDGAWWVGTPGVVSFGRTGVQTLRIQNRDDGARIDQIVISPSDYLNAAPGAKNNDTAIVSQ